jgi:ribosomal-protein-alanine N-acetyltransferase
MRLLVTPLTRRHLPEVVAIERASFARPWAPELFEAEIRHRHALPLVAQSLPAGMVVGYLCLWLVAEEVQVQNLAVHPAFRRRGVGRFLLAEGLREAHRRGARLATLEVRPSNLAARRLYASLGFVETGRRPGYYQAEGEDALLLDCRLEEAAWLRTGTGKALDHRRRSN